MSERQRPYVADADPGDETPADDDRTVSPPPKATYTARVRYRHIGRGQPRTYPTDDPDPPAGPSVLPADTDRRT